MATATSKHNEDLVLTYINAIRDHRISRELKRAERFGYDKTREEIEQGLDHVVRISVRDLADELDLSYGQAAGAVKRLLEAGRIVEFERARGGHSASYTCQSEIDRRQRREDDERSRELEEQYGDIANMRASRQRKLDMLQAELDRLRAEVRDASTFIELDRIQVSRIDCATIEYRQRRRNAKKVGR